MCGITGILNYSKKEKINENHHIKILKLQDFLDFIKTFIINQDEPIANYINFPMYAVSKFARDNGVSVCQTGEGSDELFMGHPSWRSMLRLYELNKKYDVNFFKKTVLAVLKIAGRKEESRHDQLIYYDGQ